MKASQILKKILGLLILAVFVILMVNRNSTAITGAQFRENLQQRQTAIEEANAVIAEYEAKQAEVAQRQAETAQAETAAPEPTPTPTPAVDPDSPEGRAKALGFTVPPDIDIDSWEYILANASNSIEEYAPEDITTLEGQQFDGRMVEQLAAFAEAARAEGLSVYLSSGYRDYATQTYLYNRKISQGYTAEQAATIVAPPGTSEHQTGLVCDITDKYYESKDYTLEQTALYQWMSVHCQEYGFIVRYPRSRSGLNTTEAAASITGIIYEPWHFRYVGVEAATYIMENDICLEEFVYLYRGEVAGYSPEQTLALKG